MNPRNLGNFLKSKFGLFVVFVVVLFSGLWIYGQHQASERATAKLAAQKGKKIELGQMREPLDKGLERGLPQQVRPSGTPQTEKEAADGGIVPFRPVPTGTASAPVGARAGGSAQKAEAKPRKIRYASLLATYDAPSAAKADRAEPLAPERFMPFGTLLKCKLVNTIDSANLETPVIAVLLEDVWQNGKKVVPANTLVHGSRAGGPDARPRDGDGCLALRLAGRARTRVQRRRAGSRIRTRNRRATGSPMAPPV